MLEETSIRGRRARIPWACGHEATTRSQTLCLTGAWFSEVRRRAATQTDWRPRLGRGRPL